MEEVKKTSPWATAMKWGIIAGIIGVALGLIGSMGIDWTNFEEIESARSSWLQWLGNAILLIAIIMAQLEHRKKDLGGYMNYGRSVGVATITGLASGVCSAIYVFIFFGILHPEIQDVIVNATISKMEDMPSAQEEEVIKWTRIMTGPKSMAIWTLLGSVFMGLVVGLISSIFIHKSDPNPDYN